MKAKTYVFWLMLGILTGIAALTASVEVSLDAKPESGRWVAEILEKKLTLVRTKSPQLVIVGGSSSLFGFSARILTEKYGIPSVNASTHAGLTLEYILGYAKTCVAPGRTFILPLEYELYGKANTSGAFLHQIIGYDSEFYRRAPVWRKAKIIASIPMADRIRFVGAAFFPQAKTETLYQSRTLNEWGDETGNSIEQRTDAMLARVVNKRPQKYNLDEAAWSELAAFVKFVHTSGGRVALAFPTIYEGSFNAKMNQPFLEEIHRRAKALGVTIVGTPEKHAFDKNHAYDTNYHQNSTGQTKSTDLLYLEIREAGLF
jgi:hypothetical protein